MIKGNHVKQQPPSPPTAALKQAMLDPLSANESPHLVMQAMLGLMLSDLHDAERLAFFKCNSHRHVTSAETEIFHTFVLYCAVT